MLLTAALLLLLAPQDSPVLTSNETIFASLDSSVTMNPYYNEYLESNEKVNWFYIIPEKNTVILRYSSPETRILINIFYKRRLKFDKRTGSIKLQHLEMTDSGIYEGQIQKVSNITERFHLYSANTIYLEIEKLLSLPLIIQDPIYVTNVVKLNCIIKENKHINIWWTRGDKIINNTDYENTLVFNNPKISHCGWYTCNVKNQVSQRNRSYFLIVDGRFVNLILYSVIRQWPDMAQSNILGMFPYSTHFWLPSSK
uniref:Ig-like domain-containing protein n=1 Tax=Callorhinchus milii TaxID=7868 RepID=A0A4W3IIQ8_CALMI